jgi:hypothetical protein
MNSLLQFVKSVMMWKPHGIDIIKFLFWQLTDLHLPSIAMVILIVTIDAVLLHLTDIYCYIDKITLIDTLPRFDHTLVNRLAKSAMYPFGGGLDMISSAPESKMDLCACSVASAV